ncbi:MULTISPECIES: hypothetical protein [unclassified Rhizobium]|uniref:hypothetical protein n=1 Tax=unclassified Rhizobium TaxID=2613769 RepID=UPI00288918EB|nr:MULTISPECIES: hypothetical protein [unclassified Rhizobium]
MAKPTQTNTRDDKTAQADDGRAEYQITKDAPLRVAGRRVKAGDKLRLTEDEALAELIALHIEPTKIASEGA